MLAYRCQVGWGIVAVSGGPSLSQRLRLAPWLQLALPQRVVIPGRLASALQWPGHTPQEADMGIRVGPVAGPAPFCFIHFAWVASQFP